MRSDGLWGCRKRPLLPWPWLWCTHPGKNQTCFDFGFSLFCKLPWSLKMAPEKLSFVLFEMTAVVFCCCCCCFVLFHQEFHVMPLGKICCLKWSGPPPSPNTLCAHLLFSSESRELLLKRGCSWSSAETEEMSKCYLDWSLCSCHLSWSRRWTLIDYWAFSFWACPHESLLSPLHVC